jgi:hypothetical protein
MTENVHSHLYWLKRCICTPIGWKDVFAPIPACDISIYMDWCSVSVCEKQYNRTKSLREKERISSKREMVQFLHDGMRTSSLDVRIEEVAASRLLNRGIGSVSAVLYLQQSDSRRLTVQEMQRKGFDTSDVIRDARSKKNTSAGNSEFSYLHYF